MVFQLIGGFSDTETLLACISFWGVKNTSKLKGCLHLRFGTKLSNGYLLAIISVRSRYIGGGLVTVQFLEMELKHFESILISPKSLPDSTWPILTFYVRASSWCIHPGIF